MAKKKADRPIRAVRHDVAVLKRKGLIDASIDARSVQPTPAILRAIKKFRQVITGNAAVLPRAKLGGVSAADLKNKKYQTTGRGANAKVIVPKFRDEKVVPKRGLIEFVSPEGIRRVELPAYKDGTDIRKYFGRLETAKKIEPLEKGESYAARFFNGRTRTYRSLPDLIKKIKTYTAVRKASGRKDQLELIRNFEIVKVRDRAAWSGARKSDKAKKRGRKK
jgi:hypothetical protein